jgi:hypothetical protein
MELISYKKLIIATGMTTGEIISRMKDNIGPKKYKNFSRIDNHIFSGGVVGEQFKLKLHTTYHNSWAPEVVGTILERNDRAELMVTLKSNSLVIIFTIAFMIVGLIMFTVEIIGAKDYQDFDWSTLLFVFFPYGCCWFGFNLDARRSIDGLTKISNGKVL